MDKLDAEGRQLLVYIEKSYRLISDWVNNDDQSDELQFEIDWFFRFCWNTVIEMTKVTNGTLIDILGHFFQMTNEFGKLKQVQDKLTLETRKLR